MIDWDSLNAEVIAEFRANRGRVARFGENPLAILHTICANSGEVREIPLVVVLDGDEMLVFGTKAGSTSHPSWYFDLTAHPRIEIEYGTERFAADVLQLPEAEARQKVQDQSRAVPQFAKYVESAAPRVIPVFSITRV
jgi:deazaflavin-dependent oxidoreductase (nitroreductase family)